MRCYCYRATLEPGHGEAVVVAGFADVPEAITQGEGREAALEAAEEALGLALLSYPMRGRPLPAALAEDGVVVTVSPEVGAKLALLEAFAETGLSKSKFARRIGKDEKEVRRLLDPMHPTKLPTLSKALAALGRRLVVGVEPIERVA